ncbi:Serine/threonine-protein kinase, partial [Quaeritorhiza haematococci]
MSGLMEAHSRQVYHGDLKTENVLVTSWNWAYIADFSSFKPTYLPEDNPADFSFFFDTSLRRTCYLAPERFHAPGETLFSDKKDKGKLSPAMDVFSLGCTIAELFLEGTPLFSFSQLLRYRSGEYDPNPELEKIEDAHIKTMVRHMIQLDPSQRHSVEQYLDDFRGTAFPDFFYTFLHGYVASLTDPAAGIVAAAEAGLLEPKTGVEGGIPFSSGISTSSTATNSVGTYANRNSIGSSAGISISGYNHGTSNSSGGGRLSTSSLNGGESQVLIADSDAKINKIFLDFGKIAVALDMEKLVCVDDFDVDDRDTAFMSTRDSANMTANGQTRETTIRGKKELLRGGQHQKVNNARTSPKGKETATESTKNTLGGALLLWRRNDESTTPIADDTSENRDGTLKGSSKEIDIEGNADGERDNPNKAEAGKSPRPKT